MEKERKADSRQEMDWSELLYKYGKAVKSYWWVLVLLCVTFALLLPLGLQLITDPEYKASCTMTVKVVNNSVTSELYDNYSIYYDKDLAEQLDKTFTYILTSDHLTDRVERAIGEKPEASRVEAEAIEGSNMFEVHAFGETPQQALDLLTAVMDAFPDSARYVVGDLIVDMVEEPTVEETPSNEINWTLMLAIGAVVGFVAGSALVLIPVWSHRTVRKPEELEEMLNMPCLGVLSRIDPGDDGEFRECIRGVARKVETAMQKSRILLVTGTLPEEGKSTVAKHLAQTLAGWGKQVCLIDCDLRKPSLYKSFGIKNMPGSLQAFLQGNATADTALCPVGIANLQLVGNIQPVAQPTELLDTPAMKQLVTRLSARFDIVIMDAPPCDTLSDVMVLQQYADQILYVVRQDFATVPRIINAVESMCGQGFKLMGYTMTFAAHSAYGYGKYGYGKYSYGKYGNGYYGKYGKYGSKYYHTEQSEGPSEK